VDTKNRKLNRVKTKILNKIFHFRSKLKANAAGLLWLCYNLDREGVPDSRIIRLTFEATSRTAFICLNQRYDDKK